VNSIKIFQVHTKFFWNLCCLQIHSLGVTFVDLGHFDSKKTKAFIIFNLHEHLLPWCLPNTSTYEYDFHIRIICDQNLGPFQPGTHHLAHTLCIWKEEFSAFPTFYSTQKYIVLANFVWSWWRFVATSSPSIHKPKKLCWKIFCKFSASLTSSSSIVAIWSTKSMSPTYS
jgi:hypothetical protein